jgi:hypothetical protein
VEAKGGHQSNHEDTKAQRNNPFPRAAHGNDSSCLSVFLFLGVLVFSLFFPRQTAQKSMTKKAAKTNPMPRIRQHLQGVYFLSH